MGAFLTLFTSAAVILLVIHGGLCVDIIGGSEVAPHSRPFMALIQSENGRLICGGALIKKNWVLTAAHCTVEGGKVILGAHSQKAREREKQVFMITRAIRYPGYHCKSKEKDIMLLKLDREAILTTAVQIIHLPTSVNDPIPGTTCAIAGWGQTDKDIPRFTSDTLREVNVTVISRQICNDKEHYNNNPVLTENMICAGDKKGEKDSCFGDSGGPLRCNNVMTGITAFGKSKCAAPDGPGVYTRLTKPYIQWIRTTIQGAE
ncbi:granzyme A-like [Rhynochetos jubatus]